MQKQSSEKNMPQILDLAPLKSTLPFKLSDRMFSCLLSLLQADRFTSQYAEIYDEDIEILLSQWLKKVNVTTDIQPEFSKILPKEGPLLLVSNHPTGFLETLILLYSVLQVRSDVKLMSDSLLTGKHVQQVTFPVDSLQGHSRANYQVFNQSVAHLKSGGVLILFPSGEVATQFFKGQLLDGPWKKSLSKLAAYAPVLPVYITAKNKRSFYWVSKIHPLLRRLFLVRAFLAQENATYKLSLGGLVSLKKGHLPRAVNYLYGLTHALPWVKAANESSCNSSVESMALQPLQPLQPLPSQSSILDELYQSKAKQILYRKGGYLAFYFMGDAMPVLLKTLQVERERIFRQSNMGTGLPLDSSEHDKYAHHLVIWDEDKGSLVSAMRLFQLTHETFTQDFQKGYLSNCYDLDVSCAIQDNIIEMSRVFVMPDYQGRMSGLPLLWKACASYIAQLPTAIRYLVGMTSFHEKNYEPLVYKALLHFIAQQKTNASQWLNIFKPKHAFQNKEKLPLLIKQAIETCTDYSALEILLSSWLNKPVSVPNLFTFYTRFGGSFSHISTDPDFSGCNDVLTLLDMKSEQFYGVLKFYLGEDELRQLKQKVV